MSLNYPTNFKVLINFQSEILEIIYLAVKKMRLSTLQSSVHCYLAKIKTPISVWYKLWWHINHIPNCWIILFTIKKFNFIKFIPKGQKVTQKQNNNNKQKACLKILIKYGSCDIRFELNSVLLKDLNKFKKPSTYSLKYINFISILSKQKFIL